MAYAAVFVDDLVLVSALLSEINTIKAELSRKWAMKDLGPLNSILGMKVMRDVSAGWLTVATLRSLGPVLVGTTDLYEHVRRYVQLAHLKVVDNVLPEGGTVA